MSTLFAAVGMGAMGTGTSKKRGRPKQEGSWASDRQRTNVKRGKFSEKEKETIRDAVKECALLCHMQRGISYGLLSRSQDHIPALQLMCSQHAAPTWGWSAPHNQHAPCYAHLWSDNECTCVDLVPRYAAAHGHSQDDLSWLFKSRTTPGVYSAASGGAWQQIAKALPDRTTQQVPTDAL